MRNRFLLSALSVLGLLLPLTGCTNSSSGLDSISISPSAQSVAVGQTTQLSVTGTYGNGNHLSTKPLTAGVTWSSNTPSVATVDASGVVTGVGNGTAAITATAQAFNGPTTSSAIVTVGTAGGTGGGGGGAGSLVSIAIIPSSQSVATAGQTTQFIAIGTSSTGSTSYLTNAVAWSSSTPAVATIGATTGLATAVGAGTTTITALYTSTAGAVVTGIATLTVSAGASEQATSLSLLPTSLSLTASGQTSQLILLGVAGANGLTENLTSSPNVTWTSSTPTVATVNNAGLVTGVNAGSATIVAQYTNTDKSVVTASAPVTVSISGTGTSLEEITSLTIIPSSMSVGNLQSTGQFLAIGTFSTAPYVRDVTNLPTTTWFSSFPNDFPVNNNTGGGAGASAGIVTAYASGGATIIAESTSADGTIQSATATFNCPLVLPPPPGSLSQTPGSCYPGSEAPSLISTLTVYNRGLNTANWQITAASATGTPNVLHCGPGWAAGGGAGGSVCTASYPVGTTVTVTSPAGAGAFGGWSYNCLPVGAVTAAGPNSCRVTLTTDDTVGAIIN